MVCLHFQMFLLKKTIRKNNPKNTIRKKQSITFSSQIYQMGEIENDFIINPQSVRSTTSTLYPNA